LDEPTSGLDPLMEAVFQDEILKEKAMGRSVLLSSHILSEAEVLADRVSIIRDGRVVETGTLGQLRHRARSTIRAVLESPPESLEDLAFIEAAMLDGQRFSGAVDVDDMNRAMETLSRYGISSLTVAPPSLEDLFLRHYGVDAAGDDAP